MKEKIQQLIRYHLIKKWYEKYERVLLPAMLLFGVTTDALAFTKIEINIVFTVLGVYLFLVGAVILFLNAYDARWLHLENRLIKYIRLASPLLLQFLFGALLNAIFIFYFFSGTLFVSWPFLLFVVLLMISNDVFRHYYLHPLVQASVYFFLVLSYGSIVLPFVFNSLSPRLFVFNGIASLIFICIFIYCIIRLIRGLKKKYLHFAVSIVAIFLFINGLYFFNIIPPIPLSIRDINISHSIGRQGNDYVLEVEHQSWWDVLVYGRIFHKTAGENVSVFTTIFAPKSLNAKIVHDWQWYDETHQQWVSMNKLSFTLTGGRKDGFRGYSTKTSVPAGAWRVYVETERGQVLGRVSFEVVPASGALRLKEIVQ